VEMSHYTTVQCFLCAKDPEPDRKFLFCVRTYGADKYFT